MSGELDGQLDSAQQAAFQGHLAQCPVCRAGFLALQQTVARLQDLDPVQAPADLISGINAAIDRPGVLQRLWRLPNTPPMQVALGAVTVLVVVLLCVPYLNPSQRDIPATVDPAVARPATGEASREFLVPRGVRASSAAGERMDIAEADTVMDLDVPAESPALPKATAAPLHHVPATGPDRAVSPAEANEETRRQPDSPVLRKEQKRRDALWAAPVPEGLVGGLHAKQESDVTAHVAPAAPAAVLPAPDELRAQAMVKRRTEQPAVERGLRVLHIEVAGLPRETILEALEDPVVEDKPPLDSARERRPPGADPSLDDALASSLIVPGLTLEGGGEVLALRLTPPRLDAFLKRLAAQRGRVAVGAMPKGGAAGEQIDIRIQIMP